MEMKCRNTGGLFLSVLLLSYLQYSCADLYNSSDPMVILNVGNVFDTTVGTPNAWVIEFYSSWCGHCIKFAPTWREFAYQVIEWDHTIAVGALDCADEENAAVCRDFEVKGYPTIKLFGANMEKGDIGVLSEKRDAAGIQSAIIEFLLEKESANEAPPTWANLIRYDGPIDTIMDLAPEEAKHAAIIVETQGSNLAEHSVLDLGGYPLVYTRSMTGESPHLDSLELPSLPAVIVVDRSGGVEVLTQDVTTREEVTALIMQHLNLRRRMFPSFPCPEGADVCSGNDTKTPTDEMDDPSLSPAAPVEDNDTVYMVDIENTLSYAFGHEVALQNMISDEAVVALQNFTNILVKYLPTRPLVHQFLVNMKDYLKDVEVLSGVDYETALQNIQSAVAILPAQQSWVGCMGSDPKYRGYPCGLWTLFHTLTVNAAVRDGDSPSYDPLEVMRGIHGYVKHFFGCQHCSKHFQAMYAEDAESFVQNTNDEIVWLWRSHNKVNERLKGDLSEDPQYVKQLFPTVDRCPQCLAADGSGTFDVDNVTGYLKTIYGEFNISLDGSEDLSNYGIPRAQTNLGEPNWMIKILGELFSFLVA